jgi:hypothetical protein
MADIRLFDPIGLLEKTRELRKLREQIEILMDRIAELREERRHHERPKNRRKVATQQ